MRHVPVILPCVKRTHISTTSFVVHDAYTQGIQLQARSATSLWKMHILARNCITARETCIWHNTCIVHWAHASSKRQIRCFCECVLACAFATPLSKPQYALSKNILCRKRRRWFAVLIEPDRSDQPPPADRSIHNKLLPNQTAYYMHD